MLGPTGVGKSFVACALAQKACRDGYSAFYTRAAALFRDLAIARADGSLRSLLARLSRIDVLVIDDWAMAPLAETERRDFWEICEDRYQTRSTILTSQLPVARWHEQIGDPTAADGILDRLVHNAHRIEMRGDSMRKKRGTPSRRAERFAGSLQCSRRGQGLLPLSPHPFLRQRQPSSASLRIRFSLTKPNTSGTIELPASLRSECCSPSARNAVRVPFGISVRLRRNPQRDAPSEPKQPSTATSDLAAVPLGAMDRRLNHVSPVIHDHRLMMVMVMMVAMVRLDHYNFAVERHCRLDKSYARRSQQHEQPDKLLHAFVSLR